MDPLTALLAVLLLLALVYWYGTKDFGSLEKLGVPVIKPYPFIGSILKPWESFCVSDDLQNARKYGRLWGLYEGPWAQLFVADVDMAKHIMIKDFDHFQDRPVLFDFEYGRDQMDMMPADRWKVLRSLLAPALTTSGRLKAMTPTMQQCLDDACRRMEAKLRDSPVIDAQADLFGPLTLDVMAQFSFGMKVPDVADKNSVFVKHASAFGVPTDATPNPLITYILTSFPSLGNRVAGRQLIPAFRYFLEMIRRSIKQRRAEGVHRPDLVGVIMDAIDNKVPTAEYRQLRLTEEILLLQGAEMLMAAYDTVGSALNKSAYFLATEPEAAEEVAQEAQELDELTYESVAQLPKLEAFIKEVLRMAPLLVRHFRVCTRDWEYQGLRVPAGTSVTIPMSVFHMDEQLFPEARQFRPARWLEEDAHRSHQYSWMPFGLGPHACLGARLAMVECKFFLAGFLRRYRFLACDQTKFEYLPGSGLFATTKPIMVKVEKL
ncbi:Cytochrome P450 3A24 [Amphibalanus amphitrite]|uniref:Cytochrome P450 3A24 n=1 Tax=Amphibalanus amphitrite TaxID=1232801 RepID=A0A6A4VYP5_AMPAM|nr:Cytochrome P450 3A24 [Amphibalanus amphitrite]